MRSISLKLLPVSACTLLFFWSIFAMVPVLQGPVNDYAGVLTKNDISHVTSLLLEQEKKTSNQIVILMIPSLEGRILEEYTNDVFKGWKLGQKEKDNGILIVAAIADRKIRIEVGYGLEGVLTDVIAAEIIRNTIVPQFKKNNYAAGLTAALKTINQVVKGEYQAETHTTSSPTWWNHFSSILFLIICFYFFKKFLDLFHDDSDDHPGGGTHIPMRGSWGSGSSKGGYSGGGGRSGGGGSSGGW